MAWTSAAATEGLFPNLHARVLAAQAWNNTGALIALHGRVWDPTSLGALAMVKSAGIGAIFVAVFAIITVIRHTRAEEESGRLDLVGATTVGRLAPLTAAVMTLSSRTQPSRS